ncbi:MAG: hypothetical protein AAFS10_00875 [Myxococcota bacterium]
MEPRVVMVRRRTEYESLLRDHGTAQMAAFRLKQRGLSLDEVSLRHRLVQHAAEQVLGSVPVTWRKSWVLREDLDRFPFTPEDIVVGVGLDGLVPNVAKYLEGQPVIGVNPFPKLAQKMMNFRPDQVAQLYSSGAPELEHRSMVAVEMDDGRTLIALNELFCGHRSHQSAKYDIDFDGVREYQSSSGLIVATGTGATGWAQSIASTTGLELSDLPNPTEPGVMFLIREAWASTFTGTDLLCGWVSPHCPLRITCKMQEGGVIFGDGIESDHLAFGWGELATFQVAARTLNLVVPGSTYTPWQTLLRPH